MFDIGFSEILVIAGLSLVVLGPDKLPRVVKTVGRWAGRARAMARQFSDQLAAEADNLKVDLDSKATGSSGTSPPPSAAAAAAAAAAPTPPPEFTGAPVEPAPVAAAPANAAPGAQPEPPAETVYPSANGSGHADLSHAEGAADAVQPGAAAQPDDPAEPYDPANPPIPKPVPTDRPA
jgi:sec-independent protein translocase protein TatB